MVGNPHRAQISQFEPFGACPLIETRQRDPCRATRGDSISVKSTLPPLKNTHGSTQQLVSRSSGSIGVKWLHRCSAANATIWHWSIYECIKARTSNSKSAYHAWYIYDQQRCVCKSITYDMHTVRIQTKECPQFGGLSLYRCTAVLLYCCTAVLLYYCTTTLLYCCTTGNIYIYIYIYTILYYTMIWYNTL